MFGLKYPTAELPDLGLPPASSCGVEAVRKAGAVGGVTVKHAEACGPFREQAAPPRFIRQRGPLIEIPSLPLPSESDGSRWLERLVLLADFLQFCPQNCLQNFLAFCILKKTAFHGFNPRQRFENLPYAGFDLVLDARKCHWAPPVMLVRS